MFTPKASELERDDEHLVQTPVDIEEEDKLHDLAAKIQKAKLNGQIDKISEEVLARIKKKREDEMKRRMMVNTSDGKIIVKEKFVPTEFKIPTLDNAHFDYFTVFKRIIEEREARK